jgi:phosphate transport system substrate-binding protein
MMQEWASAYKKAKKGEVNYQAKGSGSGIGMMTKREVDFGCSDAPLNDQQLKEAKDAGGDVVHVPLVMGGIVPIYNLPDKPDLVFSGEVLVDIYMGRIKKWDHEAIKKLNPKVKLPAKDIAVAYRSDSSGSTFILTDYFEKVNKKSEAEDKPWTQGKGTAIKFKVGTGSKGSDGMAGYVKQTDGAIGYVEQLYAKKNDIAFGAVLNRAGKAVKASVQSVKAAADNSPVPDDLRSYSITDAKGDDAYPIAGTVWVIAYVKLPADRVKPLTDFLSWVTHDGQKMTDKLDYTALPEALVKRVDEQLKKITAQ